MFETLDGFRRHVNGRTSTHETEPEIFEFIGGNDATLLQVDHQVKFMGEITMDRSEHALGTTLRLG